MPDTALPLTAQPEPRIGSYRLLSQLGAGGMGSVYRALHTQTNLEVAVKILPRYLAKNATLLSRFLREAKNVEALEHPNIVAIYDRGSDQGRHYLVLEYVAGGDLHDRIRTRGLFEGDEVVAIIRAVAQGLQYAATQGVIHRDIKPANLLLSDEGAVKITDLGLALQVLDEDERVTRDGTTVGTVDYMAPEQARDSRATSVRSDIYSLGCTAYYLLTGHPPFPGGDVTNKLRRHATEPAPDVRRDRPELSPALSRVLRKMMEKDPKARYPDYRHLIEALDVVLQGDLDTDGDPRLVPIDDDSAEFIERPQPGTPPPRPSRSSSGVAHPPPPQAPEPRPSPAGPNAPLLRQILEEDTQVVHHLPAMSRRTPEASVRAYIVRGALIGLAIATLGVVLRELIFYVASQAGTIHSPPAAPTPEPGQHRPPAEDIRGASAVFLGGFAEAFRADFRRTN